MNKGIKYILIALLAAVVAGVGIYFVKQKGSDAYLNALPKQATALARMDVRQLLKDADLSAEEINTLTEQLGTTPSQMSSMGIDLAKPAYGFVSPSGYFGMLCKVSQEDDLRQFLATSRNGHTITAIQQQRGYSWAVIDGNYLVAFGDGKLLGMGPAVGAAQDQLRNEMYRYLEQDKKESGVASTLYERLRGMDDALAAVLTMGILPEAVGKAMSGYIPASATKDAVLALIAQVEPHAAHLRTELFADNKEAKQYMEQFEEVFNTIDGSLLAQTQDNTALWLCANIEGDEVLKMLRKVPAIRTVLMALNFVFDADQMLKAIDGDVAVELAGMSGALSRTDKPLQLTAELDNTDFLKNTDYWLKSGHSQITALSPTSFAIKAAGQQFTFGVADKCLYVTTNNAMRQCAGNAYLQQHKSDIRGLRFYATADMQQLAATEPALATAARHIQRVSLSMKQMGQFQLDLLGTDDGNLLLNLLQ